jgi:hypothetical protein
VLTKTPPFGWVLVKSNYFHLTKTPPFPRVLVKCQNFQHAENSKKIGPSTRFPDRLEPYLLTRPKFLKKFSAGCDPSPCLRIKYVFASEQGQKAKKEDCFHLVFWG